MICLWYRSRLFWLGLPGLVFLLWGWGSSNSRSTRAYHAPWELESARGRVMLLRLETRPHFYYTVDLDKGTVSGAEIPRDTFCGTWGNYYPPRPGLSHDSVHWTERKWFRSFRIRFGDLAPGARYTFIALPYSIMTFFYAIAWIVAMTGWQRRKSRLLKLHAEPPP